MTEELKQWLAEWLEWVKRGAPKDLRFRRDHGLCIQPSMRAADLVAELDRLLIEHRGSNVSRD